MDSKYGSEKNIEYFRRSNLQKKKSYRNVVEYLSKFRKIRELFKGVIRLWTCLEKLTSSSQKFKNHWIDLLNKYSNLL